MKKGQTTVMTFGTFDIFHPGHAYYLSQAARLGERLITVVARDTTVLAIKGKMPRENEHRRREGVRESAIAHEVVLGSEESPFQIIEKYKPDVLCFGYDQKSFNDERLEQFLRTNHLDPKIIIIPPFEPEKWKSSKLSSKD